MPLKHLLYRVRACAICEANLPLGACPVLQVAAFARLLILSPAPGRRVHKTGVPWNDASGERLRGWMAIDRSTFYDDERAAILPVGLRYPGSAPFGGDNPSRRECAPPLAWASVAASFRSRAHTVDRSSCSAFPARTGMQGLHDGHGEVAPAVLASVHAAAAPKLAQRSLDAPAPMVRDDSDTGSAPRRKRNDAAVVREVGRRL